MESVHREAHKQESNLSEGGGAELLAEMRKESIDRGDVGNSGDAKEGGKIGKQDGTVPSEDAAEARGGDPASEAGPSGRNTLLIEKHKAYIKSLDNDTATLDYQLTEHLRMSGVYWGLTAMDLMHCLGEMDADRVIKWVMSCQHANGAFGGNGDHDAHLLYTLSAVQILALYDKLDLLDGEKIAAYVAGLQQDDGSFAGDEFGEIDTRFSYAAILCLSLLNKLDSINVPRAVDYIMQCQNFDGGFGVAPGLESHAGQIFCCVASLALTGSLHRLDRDLLGWWLAERQVKEGGLNGRPEKLPDVCYSWWVLSSLVIMDRVHWIDQQKLQNFILNCQDEERGGISDRPDDMVDVFHTYFGVAGLSLLGYPGVKTIDPAYALPIDVVEKILRSRTHKST